MRSSASLLLLLVAVAVFIWASSGSDRRARAPRGSDGGASPPKETRLLEDAKSISPDHSVPPEHPPTKLVGTFSIDVILRRRDGTPAAGVLVQASDRGRRGRRANTDDEGRLRFEALPYSPVTLHVFHGNTKEWLGEIVRSAGDVTVEHTIRDPLRFNLRLVGGNGGAVQVEVVESPGCLMAGSVTFDAQSNRLRGALVPPPALRELTLRVEQEGALPAEIRMPVRSRDKVWWSNLAIPTQSEKGHLRFDVVGEPPGWLPILVVDTVHDDGSFEQFSAGQLAEQALDLLAGRYRLRIGGSTVSLGTVDITPGGSACLSVDWARLERIKCEVLLPSGQRSQGSVVAVSGEGMDHILKRRDDHLHEGWIRAGVRYRLEAQHSRYAPHPERGHFEGARGNTSVRLLLIEGPKLRFQVDSSVGKLGRVELWDDSSAVAPRYMLSPRREGEHWVATGFAPGTYSIWFEAERAAPANLPARTLGWQDVDLGEIEFDKGSSVTVRILVDTPFTAPRLRGSFLLRSEPTVGGIEFTIENGTHRFDLLPKGRYEIEWRCGPVKGATKFELDGVNDHVIEIDMRNG